MREVWSGIANVHFDAVEHSERLVFMHTVADGPANRSFGLQVAALAGLPAATVAQARRRLAELEQRGRESHVSEITQPELMHRSSAIYLRRRPQQLRKHWLHCILMS